MPIPIKSTSFISLLISLLFSSATLTAESVDNLLNEFNQKNDTSQKTIDENKGHLVLYTRDRIEKMRARTLKDILLTTPLIHYHENRYAIPDPLAGYSLSPFVSNFVRVYIDGVEITHGWFGSGVLLYGDINLDFADHIELYYGTPSFENSAEPSYLTIFIYSKDPSQDSGGKASAFFSDNGHAAQTLSYGEAKEDFSYMFNISHTNVKRDKIGNGTNTPLDRDYRRTQLFGYIKTESQIAHLQLLSKNAKSLAGLSWDATPEVSEIEFSNLHLDYGVQLTPQWHAQLAYDRTESEIRQKDDLPLMLMGPLTGVTDFSAKITTSAMTEELTYKNQLGDHHFLAGIKARQKELLSFSIAGVPYSMMPAFNQESITSVFVQDQYRFSEHHLLSLGLSYNHLERNGNIEDSDLGGLRLGYIYANENWSYKTYLYKIMFAKDPTALTILPPGSRLPIQTSWGLTQELSYQDAKQHARLLLMGMKEKNGLLTPPNLPITEIQYISAMADYSYNFNSDDRLDLHLRYAQYEDDLDLQNYEDWGGYAALSNRFGNWELYNSLVWHKNTMDKTNYFDLSTAITWNATENLSLTLKGENLLNKGIKDKLYRFRPDASGSIIPIAPLDIPVTDRRVTLQMEYTF